MNDFVYKWLKLIPLFLIMLKYKPNFKDIPMAIKPMCYIITVKTKMILHPVMPVCCIGIFDTFNDVMVTCVAYIS
ncbi:hypothetical protein L244_07710 [Salmonella enterica subsp. enterica serovar Worthington str. BCH-3194]|nr:hypothetical protein L245_25535 [Salmonella enterica subsp. enterica serovar Worthington str. BCH-4719]KAF0673946.1 hypothetical protein L244_07710 [Salmonella enterica subsp. enterica serovar Worthington str. BCH-3194]KAF0776809.1 hypothetical protein L243_39905 [Salmonella enterica subsp. enterica serovar Worthington str. BCH-3008]KAF0789147.1 hypothetical protein L246_01660 [Salmonella enterica subsp. enterica serovar Worthington str. BCH-5715]